MRTIWKFRLRTVPTEIIKMPDGMIPLSVQLQSDVPHLWAEVDTDAEQVEYVVNTYATGSKLPEDDLDSNDTSGIYVGTYQTDGWFVWHVYIARKW